MAGSSDDEGIAALLVRLVEDAKGYGRAEVDYYRALAEERLSDLRLGALFGAAALLLALGITIGAVIGLMLILAPFVGIIWAVVIVLVLASIKAAVLAWLAVRRIKVALRAPGEPLP